MDPNKRNEAQNDTIVDHLAKQDGELKRLNKALQDHSATKPRLQPSADDRSRSRS